MYMYMKLPSTDLIIGPSYPVLSAPGCQMQVFPWARTGLLRLGGSQYKVPWAYGLEWAWAGMAEQAQLYCWGCPVREKAGWRGVWAHPPTHCQVRAG